jgi:hypothetical protein
VTKRWSTRFAHLAAGCEFAVYSYRMRTRLVLANAMAVGAFLLTPATAMGDPQPLPPDEYGTFVFQTKDGKTFCYVVAEEVGCSGHFANTPIQDGMRDRRVLGG